MGFVQDDDAVGQVVQFARRAGEVAEQAVEQLHRGSNDDGRVPVFAGQALPGLLVVMVFGIGFSDAGMVLQDDGRVRASRVVEYIPVFLRGLLGDGDKWHGDNNPVHAMLGGVAQGETHCGQGFAPAGRDGQAKNAGRVLSG